MNRCFNRNSPLAKTLRPPATNRGARANHQCQRRRDQHGLNALGHTTQHAYDAQGRQVSITEAAGPPEQRITTMGYDAAGRMTTRVDADNHTTSFTYDAMGRRMEEDVWSQASGSLPILRFGYDGQEVWTDINYLNLCQTRHIRDQGAQGFP